MPFYGRRGRLTTDEAREAIRDLLALPFVLCDVTILADRAFTGDAIADEFAGYYAGCHPAEWTALDLAGHSFCRARGFAAGAAE